MHRALLICTHVQMQGWGALDPEIAGGNAEGVPQELLLSALVPYPPNPSAKSCFWKLESEPGEAFGSFGMAGLKC